MKSWKLLQFIQFVIVYHNIEGLTPNIDQNTHTNIETNYVFTSYEHIEKEFKIKPHDFQHQDIILIIDKNYVTSEYIGTQLRYFLQYIQSNTENLQFKELYLKTSIFTKTDCDKLYRIIGKPLSNKTSIVVSGSPYVCKRYSIFGNYLYFSANPLSAPLSQLKEIPSYNGGNSSLNKPVAGFSSTFNSLPRNDSKPSKTDFNDKNKDDHTKCNIYDSSVNDLINNYNQFSSITSTVNKEFRRTGKKYRLIYEFDKIKNVNNYTSNEECACVYIRSNILPCKNIKNNYIFYISIVPYSNMSLKNNFPEYFFDISNDANYILNETLDEYTIYEKYNYEFTYKYHNYINFYISTENANLELFLKIESLTSPFIIKSDFLNFARMFKFYASNPNSGFTKLRKIRRKDREPNVSHDNELNTMLALYSSFLCFFLFGFLSSIILFRQQRTLALKKIVIIENIDYDCIELQCHVSNVCTEKELMLIQRAVKLENEYRKQTTLGISKEKHRVKH